MPKMDSNLDLGMSPSDHLTLLDTVHYLLQQHCVLDALFLAEILHTEKKTSVSAYMLAVCLYQLRRLKQVQNLLSDYLHDSQCILLYARCCLELNDYQAGLLHLKGLLCVNESNESFIASKFNHEAGVAFLLLGDLNRKLHLTKEACEAYRQALSYNPFLWSAFEGLCQLEKGVTADVFNNTEVPSFLQHYKQQKNQLTVSDQSCDNTSLKPVALVATPLETEGYVTPDDNPALSKAIASSTPTLQCLATTLNFDSEKIPGQVSPRALNFTPSTNQHSSDYSTSLPHNPPRSKLTMKLATSEGDTHSISIPDSPVDVNYEPFQEIPSHQVRRSARLGGIGKSPSSLAFSRHRPEVIPSPLTVARTKSRAKAPTGKIQNPSVIGKKQRAISTNLTRNVLKKPYLLPYGVDENKPQSEETKDDDEKMDDLPITEEESSTFSCKKLLNLIRSIGSAYSCLVNYKVHEAVNLFQQLPISHRNSPWVLTQLGQAMMLKEDFKEAAHYLSDVHRQDPHRHEGMDLYGSALWHLQKESELVLLAEELEASDRTCPQTFCVLSSLMEYYRDHDAAIRYLERAIQLAPNMPYPYTLLGLEYTLVKDYDKALTSFQAATNIDPHHYNAWYGLSHLYFQQEKWVLAEISIKRALSLNSCSSMAHTQLAMIQQKQGNHGLALGTIEKAVNCNSSNYLPRYHRALILESLERYNESLNQLNELYTFLSKEPSFYKSLSRVLLKLERPQDSVLHMAWAMDYSHSSSGMIAGVALVKPHSHHHHLLLDDIEGISDSDFIPHAEDSIVSDI